MIDRLGNMIMAAFLIAALVYMASHIGAFFVRDHLPWW